jgi:hypothetical protein
VGGIGCAGRVECWQCTIALAPAIRQPPPSLPCVGWGVGGLASFSRGAAVDIQNTLVAYTNSCFLAPQVLSVMSSQSEPASKRAAYCEVMRCLHVDCAPQVSQSALFSSVSRGRLLGCPVVIAPQGLVFFFATAWRTCVLMFVCACGDLCVRPDAHVGQPSATARAGWGDLPRPGGHGP